MLPPPRCPGYVVLSDSTCSTFVLRIHEWSNCSSLTMDAALFYNTIQYNKHSNVCDGISIQTWRRVDPDGPAPHYSTTMCVCVCSCKVSHSVNGFMYQVDQTQATFFCSWFHLASCWFFKNYNSQCSMSN